MPTPRRNNQGDETWMQAVIRRCAEALESGEAPFAAAIIRDDQLISLESNLCRATGDPTAHAEVLAIRAAAEKLGTSDLSGCTLFTTCEPCPMCFSAAHFAHVDRIVYGATIGDAALAGFDQLPIFATQMKLMGRSPVDITSEYCREQCVALLTGRSRV
jgi:tRNA(Arg) A34 adenosine deaminase TadA